MFGLLISNVLISSLLQDRVGIPHRNIKLVPLLQPSHEFTGGISALLSSINNGAIVVQSCGSKG